MKHIIIKKKMIGIIVPGANSPGLCGILSLLSTASEAKK